MTQPQLILRLIVLRHLSCATCAKIALHHVSIFLPVCSWLHCSIQLHGKCLRFLVFVLLCFGINCLVIMQNPCCCVSVQKQMTSKLQPRVIRMILPYWLMSPVICHLTDVGQNVFVQQKGEMLLMVMSSVSVLYKILSRNGSKCMCNLA